VCGASEVAPHADRIVFMNFCCKYALAACLLGGSLGWADAPLVFEKSIEMPEVPAGPYTDHMAIDVQGQRLFATPQAAKEVDALDLKTGKVLHSITGFGNPHAILYRADRNRLFVTDGGMGSLRIFDATTYRELKSIKLELDADGIAYDEKSGNLYVSNGGDAAGKEYSFVSIIDTTREEKVGDVRIDSPGLEAMVIDPQKNRLYINLPESNSLAVVDLQKRSVVANWPLTKGKRNMAGALDVEHHLLYVGCRDTDVRGSIVVVDTDSGKELDRLPIGGWVDSMFYDPAKHRIYASSGVGEVFSYERQPDGTYKPLDPVDTAVMAKTSLYSPELNMFFVSVPHLGGTMAKVLVFKPE
jgi:DNA-binding beta-propeller fold protein YncE